MEAAVEKLRYTTLQVRQVGQNADGSLFVLHQPSKDSIESQSVTLPAWTLELVLHSFLNRKDLAVISNGEPTVDSVQQVVITSRNF